MRDKKRYILSRIDPPYEDVDPKDLYFALLESITSLFGDAGAARIMPVVISCGPGFVLTRCSRGYEEQTRIGLSTLAQISDRRIALHPVATSGTLLTLKRRVAHLNPRCDATMDAVQFKEREYIARRYSGQKVDLLAKGIKSQELLFLIQDDLEEL